jgi:hypothetical protein
MEAPSSIPDCPSACESDVGDIDFDTTIGRRNGAGASFRRLTEFLFTGLARLDSLPTMSAPPRPKICSCNQFS